MSSSSSARSVEGYSSLYKHIAKYPELGLFRRFGAFWAKKLHDDTSEVLARLEVLNGELQKCPDLDAKTVLDCPLRFVKEKCSKEYPDGDNRYRLLLTAWTEYDRALVRYGKTLCLSEQIMKLPAQNSFYTKLLAGWKLPYFKPIFNYDVDEAEFVPTGEKAATYQDNPNKTDTVALKAVPRGDILTTWFLDSSPWINKHIVNRLRSPVHKDRPNVPLEAVSMRGDFVVGSMDMLSCLLASILLVAAVAALAYVRPLWIRILIIGLLGTFFPLLLKLMSGNPTRGEVFGTTAAFYAVAAVFVGSTGNNCGCT
ncbi:hypothetical protein GQ44DRAFT_745303 [Phaeosphaeriaceae sp. PMI808]|nr:hypothetical protein GQ44DRAFT_745303 [Phaeosphaeriaceae sp. PMI808]